MNPNRSQTLAFLFFKEEKYKIFYSKNLRYKEDIWFAFYFQLNQTLRSFLDNINKRQIINLKTSVSSI